ncbi:copper resistance protein NlpE [Bacteroides sp. OttesenSCG-928-J23]|nr:copper resistance protein NlpE [Bacteroides sp. OttesenSCG-928-J23]MDL2304593.1 copper resistance protein NlpE [Bacteroides sp. OttesenSCG-928-D19]
MKIKLIYVALTLALGVSFSACGNSSKKEAKTEDNVQVIDAAHSSRNSLDYEGTYSGTLPCADCSGIYTELTLAATGYTLKTVYQGKEDKGENTFTTTGKYTWNAEGTIITLDGDPAQLYQVGENRLFVLDQNGARITGELAELYILKKK